MTQVFPSVPLHCGLYAVVDSVEWIARVLDAAVLFTVTDILSIVSTVPLYSER